MKWTRRKQILIGLVITLLVAWLVAVTIGTAATYLRQSTPARAETTLALTVVPRALSFVGGPYSLTVEQRSSETMDMTVRNSSAVAVTYQFISEVAEGLPITVRLGDNQYIRTIAANSDDVLPVVVDIIDVVSLGTHQVAIRLE